MERLWTMRKTSKKTYVPLKILKEVKNISIITGLPKNRSFTLRDNILVNVLSCKNKRGKTRIEIDWRKI